MKIRIFEAFFRSDELLLRLVDAGMGRVDLVVVDSMGTEVANGLLLNISEDGVLLYEAVDQRLGFLLEEDSGSLVVCREGKSTYVGEDDN